MDEPEEFRSDADPPGDSFRVDRESHFSFKIDRITISGFKCFAVSETGNADRALNCIVGPNGSGKSTILEAICFVLGVDGRELRTSNLEQLVNEARRVSEKGAQGVCLEVNMECLVSGQSIQLSRVVSKNRGGGITSDYSIVMDRKRERVTRARLHAFLQSVGIDMQHHERFVIMQNHTIALVNRGPHELMELLERLMGTFSLRVQISRKSHQIADIRLNLGMAREDQTRAEIDREQLEPVVEAWNNFQSVQTSFEMKRKTYLQHQLQLLDVRERCTATADAQHTAQLIEIESRMEVVRNTAKQQAQDLSKCESSLTRQQQQLYSEEDVLQQIQARVAAALARANAQSKEDDVAYQELVTIQLRISKLNAQAAKMKVQLKSLNRQKSDCSAPQPLHNRFHEIQQAKEELYNIDVICGYKSKKARLRTAMTECTDVPTRLAAEADTAAQELSDAREAYEQSQRNARIAEDKLNELSNELASSEKLLQHIAVDEAALHRDIGGLQSQISPLRAHAHFSDAERVVSVLKDSRSGVYGFLRDCCLVQQPYACAVNAVLYERLASTVLVESREDARGVVASFQEGKIGIVTCEIVSESSDAHEDPPVAERQLIWAPSAVEVREDRYRPILKNLLRNWWIARDAHSATSQRAAAQQRQNIVTLQGEKFFGFGEVAVHRAQQNNQFLLRAAGATKIKNTAAFQPELLKSLERNLAALTGRVTIIQHRKIELESHYERLKLQRSVVLAEIAATNESAANYLASMQAAETKKSMISLRLQNDLDAKNVRMGSVVALREEVSKLADRRQAIKQRLSALKPPPYPANVTALLRKIATAETQLETLAAKKRTLEESQQMLAERIAHAKEKSHEHRVTLERARQSESTHLERVQECLNEVTRNERSAEQLRQSLRNSNRLLNDMTSEIEHIKSVRASLGQLRETCRHRREAVAAQLESYTLPSTETPTDEQALVLLLKDQARQLQREESQLMILRERVDVHALERALECQSRIETAAQSVNTLTKQLEEACSQLDALQSQRANEFLSMLSKTNAALSAIYHRLSNGGDCAVVPLNSERSLLFENGATLEVRPESTWKSFAHLSGGQKSLAALSLSLAFNRISPCPIYLFDEVDAALDARAVQRVAAFLHELAHAPAGPQVFCVTLRPQFLDALPDQHVSLLGTYQHRGTTKLVSHMDS